MVQFANLINILINYKKTINDILLNLKTSLWLEVNPCLIWYDMKITTYHESWSLHFNQHQTCQPQKLANLSYFPETKFPHERMLSHFKDFQKICTENTKAAARFYRPCDQPMKLRFEKRPMFCKSGSYFSAGATALCSRCDTSVHNSASPSPHLIRIPPETMIRVQTIPNTDYCQIHGGLKHIESTQHETNLTWHILHFLSISEAKCNDKSVDTASLVLPRQRVISSSFNPVLTYPILSLSSSKSCSHMMIESQEQKYQYQASFNNPPPPQLLQHTSYDMLSVSSLRSLYRSSPSDLPPISKLLWSITICSQMHIISHQEVPKRQTNEMLTK